MPHTVTQFDADLEALYTRVLLMGGAVESQLRIASDIFREGDADLAAKVIDGDARVNAFEVQIDGLCATLIAKRQPAANDLRLVMAVAKIVTDLERVGDEAEKVARLAAQLVEKGRPVPLVGDVLRMEDRVRHLLRDSLDALARQDAAQAELVVADDRRIDEQFRALSEQIMRQSEAQDAAIEVLWLAKSLERIGDHAKNVAQSVIYLVFGTDVRHERIDAQKTVAR